MFPPNSQIGNQQISWEFLLAAYSNGYFPMADSKDSQSLHWLRPEMRGVIPLDKFHIPRSLARFIKKSPFVVTVDTAFPQVIKSCAEITAGREETWINQPIIDLYCELWKYGFAHSVECWQEPVDRNSPPILVGGLYGVSIGGAFFGESMFSRVSNASKVALVHLVRILNNSGYTLLDAQFINDHLKQFGIVEMPCLEYLKQLKKAIMISTKKVSSVPLIIQTSEVSKYESGM